jgi:cytochrome c-type biogenesis protein CcmH
MLSLNFYWPLAFGEPVTDLTPEKQEEFRAIADQLRCPTCTGLSVLGSDAPFSVQIRDLVKQQVVEGKSEKEIMEFFVSRYGAWILREPPQEGFNLLAWIIPVGILLLGPVLIWFFVWRRRQVVSTWGVRSNEVIVKEFFENLKLKKGL